MFTALTGNSIEWQTKSFVVDSVNFVKKLRHFVCAELVKIL